MSGAEDESDIVFERTAGSVAVDEASLLADDVASVVHVD